ncbi:MAG: PilZ domain-containing protein [Nitrospirota bacterium]|nr:MAG: PilZ domain-containing protein [Nitrospirota bacterium]
MADGTRKHQRYSYIATASLTVKGVKDDEPYTVMVHNISEGGIGVFFEKPLEIGAEVSIDVYFISKLGAEIKDRIDGKISGCIKRDDLYYIGISFHEELNPADQPNLYELFEQSIKDE